MKWQLMFDVRGNVVTATMEGHFSIDHFRGLFHDILGHPEWNAGMNMLLDYRNVDFSDVSFPEVKQTSTIHKKADERVGDGRIALLMSYPLGFGIGRMYKSMTEHGISASINVFREPEEAGGWLNEDR